MHRIVYFATHFENTYQHWPVADVCRYIGELAEAGADGLAFWFDQHEYCAADLDIPGTLACRRMERLGRFSEAAHQAGMNVLLVALANESYQDQVTPETAADVSGRSRFSHYKTQLCLSKPGTADTCIANIVRVVQRLPYVDSLVTGPRDQGGCDCRACDPWSRTYVRMSKRIFDAVNQARPGIAPRLCFWCLEAEEVRDAIAEACALWPDRSRRPPVVTNLDSREIAHGLTPARIRQVPGGGEVDLIGFAEISMLYDSGNPLGAGIWGLFGANPVPRYLAGRFLAERREMTGFCAYSEGIYEDLNKWVLLKLAVHPDRTLDDILGEYGRRYLGISDEPLFVSLVLRLEDNWRHRGTLAEARETLALARKVEGLMPLAKAGAFRWAAIRLRAELDEIVARARENGKATVTDELSRTFAAVNALYGGQSTHDNIGALGNFEKKGFLA